MGRSKESSPEVSIQDVRQRDKVSIQEVRLRDKVSPAKDARPTSIADRLTLLEGSQQGWKTKVDEKDVKQFTVEGKMGRLGEHVVSVCLFAW